MESTGLFLTENQVHAGMVVALCLKGETTPQTDDEGDPLVLQALIGGVPARRKFYPLKGGIQQHTVKDPLSGEEGTVLVGNSLENFHSNVRFMPTEVFTPANAPPRTNFSVFVDGERLMHEGGEEVVCITTDESSQLRSANGYVHKWYRKEYPVPTNAVLVPTSEVGEARVH